MSKHALSCKFCKKPIVVELAEGEYADLFKSLLPLAACNECADLRMERRQAEAKIKRVCASMASMPVAKREQAQSDNRAFLTKWTQKYAQVVARFHGMSGMAWDEEMVNLLLEKPEQWADILSHCWRTFRQYAKAPATTPPPYADA